MSITLNGHKDLVVLNTALSSLYNFTFSSDDQVLGSMAYSEYSNVALNMNNMRIYEISNPINDISANASDSATKTWLQSTIASNSSSTTYTFVYDYNDGNEDISTTRLIHVKNDPTSNHSVQFDSRNDVTGTIDISYANVDFDVLALGDLSTNLTQDFGFKNIFYQEGFDFTDSSAVAEIDISVSKLNNPGLFFLNVPVFDPNSGTSGLNEEQIQVRYFTDVNGWPDVSFSEAIVKVNPIFNHHHDQSIKKDFARSMVKDIIGTNRFQSLFKNQKDVFDQIQLLDASFNQQIREILGYITNAGFLTDADYGSYQKPTSDDSGSADPNSSAHRGQNYAFTTNQFISYATGISQEDLSSGYHDLQSSKFSAFNPLRILSSTLIGQDDADLTDAYDISGQGINDIMGGYYKNRKNILFDDLNDQIVEFWDISARSTTYFGYKDTSYNVWMENNYQAQSAGASMVDGSMFSRFLQGYKVYIKEDANANGPDLIEEVVDKKYKFKFVAGDRLHLILEYTRPGNGIFAPGGYILGGVVNNRKYEIILNMVD